MLLDVGELLSWKVAQLFDELDCWIGSARRSIYFLPVA